MNYAPNFASEKLLAGPPYLGCRLSADWTATDIATRGESSRRDDFTIGRLQVEGVGYRAELSGKRLVLNVGYSHPVELEPPDDTSFVVEERGKQITVSGIDKQVVGEISAQIRKVRPPEPYKGKGIRYAGERILRKAGKAASAAGGTPGAAAKK